MTGSPRLVDPRLIEAARAVDIFPLAQRVGARLTRVRALKWKYCGPCPGCGGTDRFALNTELGIFNCRGFGGGDTIALVQHVLGLNFVEAVEFITGEEQATSATGEVTDKATNLPPSDDERHARDLASAKRIASEVGPLLGTPGERYLQETRRIDTGAIQDILARVDAIGWHGAVYFNEPAHALHGQRLGCIVGIMTDAKTAKWTGAISRTYLAPGLTKIGKAKTLGSPMGIVRLNPDDEVLEGLFLAEGIETALAAMSIGLRPTWSTGSTSPMAKFPVLSGIEHLSVLCDNDPNGAGEDAAREVERRWRAAGRQVSILHSELPGDLNDMIRKDSQK